MTRYAVEWSNEGDAETQLAQIWLDAKDREAKDAINRAANEIDKQLEINASTKGQPLSEGLRTLNIPPLRVIFAVNENNRIVVVESVRTV